LQGKLCTRGPIELRGRREPRLLAAEEPWNRRRLRPALAELMPKVWSRVLVERFEPDVKSGKHREKKG
jgi:hypothetical protein